MPAFVGGLLEAVGPRTLTEPAIPTDLRVAVLAPHPDDFDAIAVTLKLFLDNGNPIELGVVPTGGGILDSYAPGTTPAERTRLRQEEQRASLAFFGLPEASVAFLDMARDGAEDQPLDTAGNEEIVEGFLSRTRPAIVFLPHGNDTNEGHRNVYAMFSRAAKRLAPPPAAFLIRDPKTVNMQVHAYTPFDADTAAWKAEMLRFHDSQHQRNLQTRGHGFDERILAVNRCIAAELALDCEYAEAFEIEVAQQ